MWWFGQQHIYYTFKNLTQREHSRRAFFPRKIHTEEEESEDDAFYYINPRKKVYLSGNLIC